MRYVDQQRPADGQLRGFLEWPQFKVGQCEVHLRSDLSHDQSEQTNGKLWHAKHKCHPMLCAKIQYIPPMTIDCMIITNHHLKVASCEVHSDNKKCTSSVSLNLRQNERRNVQELKLCGLSYKTWVYHYNYQIHIYLLISSSIQKLLAWPSYEKQFQTHRIS